MKKDILNSHSLSASEVDTIIDLARDMRQHRFSGKFENCLKGKTFLMLFYNASLRTRISFESAMAELGGHAQFLDPSRLRLRGGQFIESMDDITQVMSRYAQGIGIRIHDENISAFGEGQKFLAEFAHKASVPIINMGDDTHHPCQGLADLMTMKDHFGDNLKGKKILITWAKGVLTRSRYSTQEILQIAARASMDITLAFPKGYDLDPQVLSTVQADCVQNEAVFEVVHDAESGYQDADIVYSRNWVSPDAYNDGYFNKDEEIKRAMIDEFQDWICTEDKMKLTNNAVFMHPMPIDRGREVTDDVASGERSLIYKTAENRLHVQKAILATLLN